VDASPERRLARLLARAGIIAESRLSSTVGLAWPRIVTGAAIMSKRTVDLALVGLAVGPAAVAGLTVADAYWSLAKFAAIGLAGGVIALVSQSDGAGDHDRAARTVEAGVVLALALAVPVVAVLVAVPRELVGLLGVDGATADYGAAYLTVVAPGLAFEFCNLMASRTYAGVGDTRTPMVVRAGGAVANVVLSAALVLGAGLGVVGAALGTTLSTAAVTLVFAWGMTGRSLWGRGASPVPIPAPERPGRALFGDVLSISAPLVGRRVAESAVVFPLLAIAATFGPVAVAAVGVARQVRGLLNSFSWGFSIAASTLVGQALGADDEREAAAVGREIATLSLVVSVVVAGAAVVASDPIAAAFVEDPDELALTAAFVAVAAASVVPLGVDGSITGALRGAGDTRVPFFATLAGLYLVALPVAALGTVTGLGVVTLQAALFFETAVPAVLDAYRYRSGRWRVTSRAYRASADD
jgi:putative MATE family efflux protein